MQFGIQGNDRCLKQSKYVYQQALGHTVSWRCCCRLEALYPGAAAAAHQMHTGRLNTPYNVNPISVFITKTHIDAAAASTRAVDSEQRSKLWSLGRINERKLQTQIVLHAVSIAMSSIAELPSMLPAVSVAVEAGPPFAVGAHGQVSCLMTQAHCHALHTRLAAASRSLEWSPSGNQAAKIRHL